MGAADVAAAHMDRRGDDLVRIQLFHQHAYRRHVRNGVHGSHLVEMDLRDRLSVGAAFRLGNEPVHVQRVLPDLLRNRQMGNDMLHVGQTGMMMAVRMGMVMVVFVRLPVGVSMVVFVRLPVGMGMFVFVRLPVGMGMFVRMCMVMRDFLALFRAMDPDGDVGPRDAAFDRRLRRHGHLRQADVIELLQKGVPVRQQLQQRGGQHISRGAHPQIEI